MDSRRVLSSLCYFSIFFAGFIFPLVVYLASGDEVTKMHAKKSLLSHLIPLILLPFLVVAIIYDAQGNQVPLFTIGCIVILALTILIVVIWNIIKGVKVLSAE
ncbi:DUF4870 domain-containing protein [Neobacillus massiliamazoniensis]|uniref:DUF4870 domain-containing protein n=1 Tax=Neobacillus massiliamazoniensis TaxID=1499688 RepID=A0A0U1NTT3_9BACI|nr:DUF4870 domain-containing protein [Neobacillus massiliamazoniensis]CRK81446.1 Hypothetical protein BN000_01348 [Neobacillus massiliamazoniensis]